MPEFSGALPFVEHASLLWALPALPFLAALWLCGQAWLARSQPSPAADPLGRWAGPLAALGSLLAALSLAYRLGGASGASRALLAPGWEVGQFGSLDLSVGLAFDALGATLVVVLLLLGGAGQLALALEGRRPAALGAASALTGGAVLMALADGWVTAILGLGILGLGVAFFLGGSAGAGRALGSSVLLGLAGGLLFWSINGSWSSAGFVPEGASRLAALTRNVESSQPGGMLTVPELSGAKIRLDGSTTATAIAPVFRLPVPAGLHSVRVDAGPGSDEVEVRNFRISQGSELGIVVAGPTVRFGGLALLGSMRFGDRPLPSFARLTAGPLAPAGFAALAMLIALALWCYPGADSPLGVLLGQLVPLGAIGAVAARSLPLAARSASWSVGLTAGALVAALVLAGLGRWSAGAGRPIGAAAGAIVLVASAVLVCGAVEAGVVLLISTLLGAGALLWGAWLVERFAGQPGLEAGEGSSDQVPGATALLKVGYALLIGLPPLGGAFAFGEALRVFWGGPGPLAAVALVVVLGLASRAIGRVVYALTEVTTGEVVPKNTRKGRSSLPPDGEGGALAVPVGVGLAVVGAGVGLIGGTTLFAGPLAEWLGSSAVVRLMPAPGSVAAAGLLVVGWVAALAGARMARVRFGEARKPGWERADAPPEAALRLLAGARESLAAAGSMAASIDERAGQALGEEVVR